MKRILLCCITALLTILCTKTQAQTDSTKYDLGRITLNKNFTQAVTIKAADLEKIPFTTLSEALDVWLYGVYGNKQTYVTVIDGNLLNDINAYSIYDIEEITLVQNSLTHLNGILPSQIMLLVKTKRGGQGKSGINVAGQTNLITGRNPVAGNTSKSTTNYYHQYYVSAYTNTAKTQAGISADLQHTAIPSILTTGLQATDPYHFDRLKFNAYIDTKLSDDNTLSVNAGYAPQTNNNAYTYTNTTAAYPKSVQTVSSHFNENILHADVKLNSKITSGLTNTISAGVQRYHVTGRYNFQNVYTFGPPASSPAPSTNINVTDTIATATAYLIKDDLGYKFKAAGWEFEPNVNFTFKHFKDTLQYKFASNNSGGTPFTNALNTTSMPKFALLTPSLAISYHDTFLLQGGFQTILNGAEQTTPTDFYTHNGIKPSKIYPFASVTFNLLQFNNTANANTQLMVYGSYAKTLYAMGDSGSALSDPTGNIFDHNYSSIGNQNAAPVAYNSLQFNPYQTFDQVQTGVTLSMLKNKLAISYNYSVRKYNTEYNLPVVYVADYYNYYGYYPYYSSLYPTVRADMHRLGININMVHSAKFSWVSNLNGTVIKYVVNDALYNYYINTNSHIVTGGFVNRLAYKNFSAGLDLLFRLHEEVYTNVSGIAPDHHLNSFDVKNVYAAYHINTQGNTGLDIFANGRNLLQNKDSDITDNRRFYGIGLKVSL